MKIIKNIAISVLFLFLINLYLQPFSEQIIDSQDANPQTHFIKKQSVISKSTLEINPFQQFQTIWTLGTCDYSLLTASTYQQVQKRCIVPVTKHVASFLSFSLVDGKDYFTPQITVFYTTGRALLLQTRILRI